VNVLKTNNTNEKVRQLQRKLYQSAKRSKERRFHALYDKISRKDVLLSAWSQVKSNGGSAGIDGQTIKEIEAYGIERIVEELQAKLEGNSYNPPPVKRVNIPKSDGSKRPLGIPTVKDRIVQGAMKIVIEPIFESDFKESSYGFRRMRNQHQALDKIRKACNRYGEYVLDCDIKGYFNNIKHDKLMLLIEKRISDKRVKKLLMKWLKSGVMESGYYSESSKGSPQGGVISPLLSNIYLNYLDTVWERHFSYLGDLVRFADDFVIVCKNHKDVMKSLEVVKLIMNRLELELNMEKTKVVTLCDGKEGFEFLGFEIRRVKKWTRDNKAYQTMDMWICKSKQKAIREVVKSTLNRSTLYRDVKEMIIKLNRKINGWRGYYGISSERILVKLDRYIQMRLVYWFNTKKQRRSKRYAYFKRIKLFRDLGLKSLLYAS